MRIAVVDDDEYWIKLTIDTIREYLSKEIFVIDEYIYGKDFLDKGIKYDIVVMDIQISGMDGLNIAYEYRKLNPSGIIIFLTAHLEFATKGYLVNAFRYIDKMKMHDQLREALESALRMLDNRYIETNIVKLGKMRLEIRDILYIETEKRNILIHTRKNKYVSSNNITDMENMLLNYGFYRCHRSFIVNLDAIKSFDKINIFIIDGSIINLSQRRYLGLKKMYLNRNKDL